MPSKHNTRDSDESADSEPLDASETTDDEVGMEEDIEAKVGDPIGDPHPDPDSIGDNSSDTNDGVGEETSVNGLDEVFGDSSTSETDDCTTDETDNYLGNTSEITEEEFSFGESNTEQESEDDGLAAALGDPPEDLVEDTEDTAETDPLYSELEDDSDAETQEADSPSMSGGFSEPQGARQSEVEQAVNATGIDEPAHKPETQEFDDERLAVDADLSLRDDESQPAEPAGVSSAETEPNAAIGVSSEAEAAATIEEPTQVGAGLEISEPAGETQIAMETASSHNAIPQSTSLRTRSKRLLQSVQDLLLFGSADSSVFINAVAYVLAIVIATPSMIIGGILYAAYRGLPYLAAGVAAVGVITIYGILTDPDYFIANPAQPTWSQQAPLIGKVLLGIAIAIAIGLAASMLKDYQRSRHS